MTPTEGTDMASPLDPKQVVSFDQCPSEEDPMEDLKGKTAKIRVDYLAGKQLNQGDLVEILDQ